MVLSRGDVVKLKDYKGSIFYEVINTFYGMQQDVKYVVTDMGPGYITCINKYGELIDIPADYFTLVNI